MTRATSPTPRAGSTLSDVLDAWSGADPLRLATADTVARLASASIRLAHLIAAAPHRADELPDVSDLGDLSEGGDTPKPLDLAAEGVLLDVLEGSQVAAVASEESRSPVPVNTEGSLVVAVDPIDGSSNIDIAAPIGTIFSVLPLATPGQDPAAALLQSGRHQLAAGFTIYSACTVLVLTLGSGTDAYVLDPDSGDYRLVFAGLRVPDDSPEYAINASNARHWPPGIRSYISDMVEGADGPRKSDFNMRWVAALVAEAYRILLRGGIYLYPADARPGYEKGRLRLVYEANPIALIFEQAGGAATNGVERILDLQPEDHHQRTPLAFGSAAKVERVGRHLSQLVVADSSPLFGSRGLFRA